MSPNIFTFLLVIPLIQIIRADSCLFNLNSTQGLLNTTREIKLKQGYALDSLLNFTEMATEHGYPSEEYDVVTEDGYILSIFRIWNNNCSDIKKPPVLLMHDLLMSSDSWLDAGPREGLGYLLADACFDLWVGNVRGNYYGKRHQTLNPEKDIDFWQFSVNEIGMYDVPAIIDYVRNKTTADKINYIGYSQGASTFFIMCSEKAGYSDKVSLFIGLEPDSKNTYTISIAWRMIAEAYQFYAPHLTEIGIYEALPLGGLFQSAAAFICRDVVMADTVCRAFLSIIDSPHPGSVDTETIRVLSGHFPAGTSVKNMVWYSQSLNVDDFQKFDFGDTMNMELYNSTTPPTYNLTATSTPTLVINGRNDFLTVMPDIDWLTSQLPNVLEHYIVTDPLWNHLDVPYSKLASTDIMPKITEYLDKYSNQTQKT